jgi:hypothetical protein
LSELFEVEIRRFEHYEAADFFKFKLNAARA